jgi:UDP-N-acetylmuramoyl-L-alanyl-D-glutamate--2,6-diaminopimelate ligase
MKLVSDMLKHLSCDTHAVIDDKEIHNINLDSRVCDKSSVFVALKGQTTDGNKYIDSVLSNGCCLVLTDRQNIANSQNIFHIANLKENLADISKWFYSYKKPNNIIGITGTNGKTSIAHNISELLTLTDHKTLMLGTNGNGIYPDLHNSSHTTLDTLSLYGTIASYNDIDSLVMEVSSHSLDQNRAAGIEFDIAVFSNLSHDHLDYHITMEEYFLAKAKLFQMDSLSKVVINIDCEYGKRLCDISVAPVTTVSLLYKSADIYLNILCISGLSTHFELFISGKNMGVYTSNLIGDFNIMNIGLSIGCVIDIIRQEKVSLIEKITPVKGRMEVVSANNGVQVVMDYAHTPDALEKALSTLKQYSPDNLWCLFGCGGDRDSSKRKIMASVAEKYADKIIVTEDNNRFEKFDNILNDIEQGFNKNKHIVIASRKEAIEYCIKNSSSGDIVLLAGKGHELYIDKCGNKEFFDEQNIVLNTNLIT